MLLTLVAAGCGDAKKPSGQDLTHAGYVLRADAVCQKADEAIAKLGQPKTIPDLPAYAKDAAAIVSRERDDLKALNAAPGDEVLVQDLGTALDDAVTVAKALEKVAADGDPAAINDFVKQNGAANSRAKALAKQLGMKVCSAS